MNLEHIMHRAWQLRRSKSYTMVTALLLPVDALGVCKYAMRNA